MKKVKLNKRTIILNLISRMSLEDLRKLSYQLKEEMYGNNFYCTDEKKSPAYKFLICYVDNLCERKKDKILIDNWKDDCFADEKRIALFPEDIDILDKWMDETFFSKKNIEDVKIIRYEIKDNVPEYSTSGLMGKNDFDILDKWMNETFITKMK